MAVCGVTPEQWRKVHCTIGGFLAMCIAGHYYIVGNVSTYVESYSRERGDYPVHCTWFTSFILTCLFVGSLTGIVVGGYLDRLIGPHLTALIGLALLTLGSGLTFFTLKISTATVIVTFGGLPGLGFGLVYGCPYSALNKHNFKRLGLMYGIVNSGFGGGAVVFNYVMSGFINPHNQVPDAVDVSGRHFTQPDVLDRTPYSFLVLTACYLLLLPIAVSGMRPPPATGDDLPLTEVPQSPDSGAEGTVLSRGRGLKGEQESYGTCQSVDSRGDRPTSSTTEASGEEGEAMGLGPRQLLCQRVFYVIWLTVFINGMVNNSVIGYYKALGLTGIDNDLLLASIGTVGSLVSAVSRPIWGLVIDCSSLKTLFLLHGGSCCVLLAFWESCLRHSSGLFFLCTVVLFALVSAFPVMMAISCRTFFGQRHFVSNLALLWTATALQSLLLPLVTSFLLGQFGWTGLLLFMASIVFIDMLLGFLVPREMTLVTKTGHHHREGTAGDRQ